MGSAMADGGYVEYSSNNSGGEWWLTDSDWRALEEAGWEIDWIAGQEDWFGRPYKDGRFLGALATSAKRYGLSLREAIAEWEDVTWEESNALGCQCCGVPHRFTAYTADGEYVDSYEPDRPTHGGRY